MDASVSVHAIGPRRRVCNAHQLQQAVSRVTTSSPKSDSEFMHRLFALHVATMRSMRFVVFLGGFAICASGLAGDPSAWFRKLDKNRDGYLDRKELAGMHRHLAVFDQADENRDGRLDPGEFIKAEVLV